MRKILKTKPKRKKSKNPWEFLKNERVYRLKSKMHTAYLELEERKKHAVEVSKKKRKDAVKLIKSKTGKLVYPVYLKGQNLYYSFQNYIKYRQEKREFEKTVREISRINELDVKRKKKKLLMEGYEEQDRQVKVDDKYVRTYYLAEVPNYVTPSTLFKIINLPIPLQLSYHIRGTNKGMMIKAARQRKSVLESVANDRYKKGKSRDHQIDKEMDEVEKFIQDLVHDLERSFIVSIYATITASSKKELIRYHEIFQDETLNHEFVFNTYSYGQKDAFVSALPLTKDIVKEDHLFQTSVVTNLLPFLTKNLNDETGVFVGTKHFDNSLVLLDFFKARNANINIFGTSGSGKSVTAKIMMSRLALRGVQSIILDPEGEYTKITEAMEGEVITFDRENGINPFYIGNPSKDDVKDHVSVLKAFFRFFIKPERYDGAKLDKVLIELYEKHDDPIFKDFLDLCKTKDDIEFIEDLEQLQTGSLAGIFNSTKKIDLSNDVICFDLSKLQTDEKKIPAMYLLGNIIHNLIRDAKRRRMIFIDESHKLLVNEETTKFYVDLVKTARKRKAGVVSITQNPEDFKDNNGSKTILTQAETSIILKQSPASIRYIEKQGLFDIADHELNTLPTLGVGESLLIRDREHIFLDIHAFKVEKELVFTD